MVAVTVIVAGVVVIVMKPWEQRMTIAGVEVKATTFGAMKWDDDGGNSSSGDDSWWW